MRDFCRTTTKTTRYFAGYRDRVFHLFLYRAIPTAATHGDLYDWCYGPYGLKAEAIAITAIHTWAGLIDVDGRTIKESLPVRSDDR